MEGLSFKNRALLNVRLDYAVSRLGRQELFTIMTQFVFNNGVYSLGRFGSSNEVSRVSASEFTEFVSQALHAIDVTFDTSFKTMAETLVDGTRDKFRVARILHYFMNQLLAKVTRAINRLIARTETSRDRITYEFTPLKFEFVDQAINRNSIDDLRVSIYDVNFGNRKKIMSTNHAGPKNEEESIMRSL